MTCLLWYRLKSGNTFNWWLCLWKCSGEKGTFCYSVIAIFPAIGDKDNEVWKRKCWFGKMNGLCFPPYVDLLFKKKKVSIPVFFIVSLQIGIDSSQEFERKEKLFSQIYMMLDKMSLIPCLKCFETWWQ